MLASIVSHVCICLNKVLSVWKKKKNLKDISFISSFACVSRVVYKTEKSKRNIEKVWTIEFRESTGKLKTRNRTNINEMKMV